MTDEVQLQSPAKPARKPRTPKATAKVKTTTSGKISTEGLSVVAKLEKLGLPQVLTGGSLTTWSNDLESVSHIEISRDGTTWNTVWANDKAPSKPKAVVIPSVQLKALIFMVQSSLVRPVTDRGYAYVQWTAENAKVLTEIFGKGKAQDGKATPALTFRVHNMAAALPVLEFSAEFAVNRARDMFPILEQSAKIEAPQKRAPSAKQAKAEEGVEMIIGVNI